MYNKGHTRKHKDRRGEDKKRKACKNKKTMACGGVSASCVKGVNSFSCSRLCDLSVIHVRHAFAWLHVVSKLREIPRCCLVPKWVVVLLLLLLLR